MAKILSRWNPKKRCYEDHEIPNDWSIASMWFGRNFWVDCASCGACIPPEEAYTSLEIHSPSGFGYFVCEKCYNEECERLNDG